MHIIEEISADLFIYKDPKVLLSDARKQIDASRVVASDLKKYREQLFIIRSAWQKTEKYEKYFSVFYPPSHEINEVDALNHHIHAYLQDMDVLKNKIETFLGILKNDVKKKASNKSEVDTFYTEAVKKTKKVFEGISIHRNPHTHRGMRFMDGDLLKAENAIHTREILGTPAIKSMLNEAALPDFLAQLEQERLEGFAAAKKRWVETARKNDEQIAVFLESILLKIKPDLYRHLNIVPTRDIFSKKFKV